MLSRRKLLAGTLGVLATAANSKIEASAATVSESLTPDTKNAVAKPVIDPMLPPTTMPTSIAPELLPTASKQIFFYSPHPDDETLSFGMVASQLIALGYEVNLVLLSQGITTKAIDVVNGVTVSAAGAIGAFRGRHNPALEGYKPLTVDYVGAARLDEFQAAAGLLGIPANRVYTFDTHDADQYTAENIKAVISKYAHQFPAALHVTMSTIDVHPHHRIAGEALRQVALETGVKSAYAVSRTTWKRLLKRIATHKESAPELHWFKPVPKISDVVVNATLPYSAWNPIVGAFAIGYTSVTNQFEGLKSERNALYLLSTPPVAEVMAWIDTVEDEASSQQAVKSK